MGRTVLICDDEPTLRELARVGLGRDYRFAEADNGVDALRLARELRPDIVFLDVMLPMLSGLEVLEQLRRDPDFGDPRVVIVSAWTHLREEAVAAGADLFLAKPFDPDELRVAVEGLL